MRNLHLAGAVSLVVFVTTLAQTPEQLTQQLKNPEARVRRLAAEALGKQRVESASSALAELLKDRDPEVRGAAAEALRRIGAKAVPALIGAVSYPEEPSRLAALNALRELAPITKGVHTKETLTVLTAALKDKSVDVRIHAASALGSIGADAKPALPALMEAAKDTSNLGTILRPSLPTSVTEAAIAAALSIDPQCAEGLAKAALPDLMAALKSKDQALLQAAGFALAKLGPQAKPALAALQQALKNADGFAEHAITSALKAIEGASHLADIVKDPKAPIDKRERALRELAWTRDPDEKTIAIVIDALKDPAPRLRAEAVEAISMIGPKAKAAIPTLLDLLGDKELQDANDAKRVMGENAVPAALASIGAEAVPGLAEVLKDEKKQPAVRFQAVKSLAKMGRKAKAAMPTLEASISDKLLPIAVESACAYVLAGGDITKALPVVHEGLKHSSQFVLWNAANAVERIGIQAKDCVSDLLPLLKHEDLEIRIIAARALAKMGPAAKPAVPVMAELLKDKNGRLRYQVAQALAKMGPDAKSALPVLIEQLQDLEKMSPNPILVTLGNLGPEAKPALPALVKVLENGDSIFSRDVMNCIGQIGPDAKVAVPQLLRCLEKKNENEYERASAARALGLIGPDAREAVPTLKQRLEDERKMVRVWASFALARITGEGKPQVALLIELWTEDRDDGSFRRDSVRYDIAQALELLGAEAKPARDLLLTALFDERTPPGTREHVARTLGHLGTDADVIVPRVLELLERKAKPFDRENNCKDVCAALGLLGPKARAAIPRLRQLLDDEDNSIVDAAAAALEKIVTVRS
jgi:HEAT repeat protein